MTPRTYIFAKYLAQRHRMSVVAIFSTEIRGPAVTAARWELWKMLADEGLDPNQIERETGHHRASITYGLRKLNAPPVVRHRSASQLRSAAASTPSDAEGRRIVEAHIAAMHARHARDLAQRY